MSFNLEQWKQQAQEKLQQAGSWLKRRAPQGAAYLTYGTLSGLSLWPLVYAAQSGEFLPALLALGSVAGGVGSNLVANQVQTWKDKAGKVTEAEVVDWVIGTISTHPALRDELDAILEQMEAIPQARAALTAAEQGWFVETLRAELVQLGNQSRFEAYLIGEGLLVQGGSANPILLGAAE